MPTRTPVQPIARDVHAFEPSDEPGRRGERRSCAACGNSERATNHPR